MSHLRETIDPETGEVYHVETTRQAKRRYQRNGGAQYKPTVGQLNAADIWNKQEEKIKRDREREERRKKNKAKQDAKDARQREVQQEMLTKGKITVEDTWGKVNASQNRLHKFFGQPMRPQQPDLPVISEDISENEDDCRNSVVQEGDEEYTQLQEDCFQEDLEEIFTNSPLSPDQRQTTFLHGSSFSTKSTLPVEDSEILFNDLKQQGHKRISPLSSQAMMPPPKRLRYSSATLDESQDAVNTNRSSFRGPNCGKKLQSPLKEMTDSHINIRTAEKPNPTVALPLGNMCHPVASQIVRDTFSGLCSQDFDDDFGNEEKENRSPLRTTNTDISNIKKFKHISPDLPERETRDKLSVSETVNGQELDESLDESSDEFDVESIDEESLLALAATQVLKRQPFESHGTTKCGAITAGDQQTDTGPLLGTQNCCEPDLLIEAGPRLGDSFAMEGVNDADLLEGLDIYENESQSQGNAVFLEYVTNTGKQNTTGAKLPSTKSRRTLPWIKDPTPYSFGDSDTINELATSPLLDVWDEQ